MRVNLEDDRRRGLISALQTWYEDQLDEPLSEFRAEAILDFFVRELGPPIYNQAIRDAHDFIQDKLIDLEGEFYEPEGR